MGGKNAGIFQLHKHSTPTRRWLADTQPKEWQLVQRTLTLAIRLNEHAIAGSIQGEEVLTIRHAGQTVPMRFTLYVTRPPSQQAPPAPVANP